MFESAWFFVRRWNVSTLYTPQMSLKRRYYLPAVFQFFYWVKRIFFGQRGAMTDLVKGLIRHWALVFFLSWWPSITAIWQHGWILVNLPLALNFCTAVSICQNLCGFNHSEIEFVRIGTGWGMKLFLQRQWMLVRRVLIITWGIIYSFNY